MAVERARDDRGNIVLYDYRAEDDIDVDLSPAHERSRDDAASPANRYLDRVRYGNATTLLDANSSRPRFLSRQRIDATRWMFELRFDYGATTPADPAAIGRGRCGSTRSRRTGPASRCVRTDSATAC